MAFLCITLSHRMSKNVSISVLCAILLMSTLQFWYISHAVITDGFLFLFTLAIFGYSYLAFHNNDKASIIKAYIAAALAVITKGPVGIPLTRTHISHLRMRTLCST